MFNGNCSAETDAIVQEFTQADTQTQKFLNELYQRVVKPDHGWWSVSFWANVASFWAQLNELRMIDRTAASKNFDNEKLRIDKAFTDFEDKTPFDGGYHEDPQLYGYETLTQAYKDVNNTTSGWDSWVRAKGFWACLNSIRQTQGLSTK